MQRMDCEGYAKFYSEGFMPLVMEITDENISTSFGIAKLYSLAHYYELNGDLLSDPQMIFMVVDNRKDEKDFENISIFPQAFQQDNLGIFEESILIKNKKADSFKKTWQDGHASFANDWLRNISRQGFLKQDLHK